VAVWAVLTLTLPGLHPLLVPVVAAETGLHARGAWWVAGAVLPVLALGTAAGVGLAAALLALWRRWGPRPGLLAVGLAVLLLQVDTGAWRAVAGPVSRGRLPTRSALARLLPAGPPPDAPGRWLLPLTPPVAIPARVTSGFGWRAHPILGHRRFHNGVDLAVPEGTPVRAVADGVVDRTGEDPLNGHHVVLRHPDGLRSAYVHLSRVRVEPGHRVTAGQVIGASGQTGRATGPHLHLGLWRHGRAVDPLAHLGGCAVP